MKILQKPEMKNIDTSIDHCIAFPPATRRKRKHLPLTQQVHPDDRCLHHQQELLYVFLELLYNEALQKSRCARLVTTRSVLIIQK